MRRKGGQGEGKGKGEVYKGKGSAGKEKNIERWGSSLVEGK